MRAGNVRRDAHRFLEKHRPRRTLQITSTTVFSCWRKARESNPRDPKANSFSRRARQTDIRLPSLGVERGNLTPVDRVAAGRLNPRPSRHQLASREWGERWESNPHKEAVAFRKGASCGKYPCRGQVQPAPARVTNPLRVRHPESPASASATRDGFWPASYLFGLPVHTFSGALTRLRYSLHMETCAGLEPALRRCERPPARPLRVARREGSRQLEPLVRIEGIEPP